MTDCSVLAYVAIAKEIFLKPSLRGDCGIVTFGDAVLQTEMQSEVSVEQWGAIPIDDVAGRNTAQVAQTPLWNRGRER